ncbi:sulfate adenylyltransferase subunit CysN [Shewanella schlegeliana]|uniref:Sulfate adenylyltransferase subunit 1 n=1 Tax=Shewanella schlegeliana TaxID=190308 RepID=A0ABS1SXT5_9GAMM|nr:sulfate adenylyltransferase subunit CysN [Shewanella schlegeliana]MBL4912679.1 sulfate adenylyltransferase subunit CysN [Shewanella schlegeliana]MCL1109811.1 sulfate adenylyltransferase subunit CysN [Shewanella schlegeliana]GIU30201.1 sulfate adenylyltransferase subunit 1 [Shewanella schlegeliana]
MNQAVNNNARLAAELEDLGVKEYLSLQQHKGLLRFLTCGSVDDGKSTLIGRLLHDSAQIYEDQLASLKSDSAKLGTTGEEVDLALLVDGLQAEREQGITIDVAYRYFSSDKRKFIIADTPGHEQYTRNMATGASTCDLAVILVDARYGVQTQTRRHAFIASQLGIRHFVVAVNKMDLLGFDEKVFNDIQAEFAQFAEQLGDIDIRYVPLSALKGDNVVDNSNQTPWYSGGTLLELLETIDTRRELNSLPVRFPVQYVQRPDLDFRGFSGTLSSGVINVGDELVALPSGKRSKVASIVTFDGLLEQAIAGQAVTLTLEDEIDISRGDLLSQVKDAPALANIVSADIAWMDEKPLQIGQLYDLKVAGKKLQASVTGIEYLVDINTLERNSSDAIGLNDMARVTLELNESIAIDPYSLVRDTGGMILIDRLSNATVAAVMAVSSSKTQKAAQQYSDFELELNALIRKQYPHWQAIDISKVEG